MSKLRFKFQSLAGADRDTVQRVFRHGYGEPGLLAQRQVEIAE
jgi:hypothetical protein